MNTCPIQRYTDFVRSKQQSCSPSFSVCPLQSSTVTVPPAYTLSQAQLLLLFVFLANHFNVAVFPHALPQFDGTAADILPWTNGVKGSSY